MSSMFYVLLKNQALENNYEVIFREPETRWKFNVQELARYFFVFLSSSLCILLFSGISDRAKESFQAGNGHGSFQARNGNCWKLITLELLM